MKKPAGNFVRARATGKCSYRCSCCGSTNHRLETCPSQAAATIRKLKAEVRQLRGTKRAKDVKRVEHKTRKTTQTGFRTAASKRYVGKPAARTPSPAELRRLRPAPDDDEFGPLPTTEKLASDWLHEHRVFKPPGKCNCCSSKKWSNIIWPTGHDSAHYRCLTCGTRALDHFEVFIYMFFSILFANP